LFKPVSNIQRLTKENGFQGASAGNLPMNFGEIDAKVQTPEHAGNTIIPGVKRGFPPALGAAQAGTIHMLLLQPTKFSPLPLFNTY
jgi:hypothetical protein